MGLTGRSGGEQGSLVGLFAKLKELSAGLRKQITLDFGNAHALPFLLVLFRHKLHESLELGLSVVTATTTSHMRHSSDSLEVSVVLVQNTSENVAHSWGRFSLQTHFVKVSRTFLFNFNSERTLGNSDNTVLASTLDVHFLVHETLSNDGILNKHPLLGHALFHAVVSGGADHGMDHVSTLLVDVSEGDQGVTDVLAVNTVGDGGQLMSTVPDVVFPGFGDTVFRLFVSVREVALWEFGDLARLEVLLEKFSLRKLLSFVNSDGGHGHTLRRGVDVLAG